MLQTYVDVNLVTNIRVAPASLLLMFSWKTLPQRVSKSLPLLRFEDPSTGVTFCYAIFMDM